MFRCQSLSILPHAPIQEDLPGPGSYSQWQIGLTKEGHQTRRVDGLDGSQAAWVARKYKGHCVLPREFLADMQAAGIVRGGNMNAGL
ncbi:hypothetical protein C8R45DRAFT_824858 [Mycena sanguinolenta]|nr:hypothetical protein C8R45DRAFT_824858 [Mycena sanguinolenta]